METSHGPVWVLLDPSTALKVPISVFPVEAGTSRLKNMGWLKSSHFFSTTRNIFENQSPVIKHIQTSYFQVNHPRRAAAHGRATRRSSLQWDGSSLPTRARRDHLWFFINDLPVGRRFGTTINWRFRTASLFCTSQPPKKTRWAREPKSNTFFLQSVWLKSTAEYGWQLSGMY